MAGGGCWCLMPGQVTDDSEMAMSLAAGILKFVASGSHTAASFGCHIAANYLNWKYSIPI
eukprot:gnl/Chilomastix_caulleri/6506.p1 GENE.gnl/Chilomastix_caulleri/6506~~gnl/Chilomastix_caulleri/6506.p1  ORF type:complete len:60 (-),score=6.78 gnl/Chilomastix_caulleri/6506:7-186(-)